ncbi:39S ribosomal protein L1, mitochondrial [Osmerus eperlanus]|uniref:39S ribosomal protein L1, mitochondrial n=1 Tax=Osmerus eperlanus TaxID=29151 RepID=UPI002E116172
MRCFFTDYTSVKANMATCTRSLLKVVAGCQRQILTASCPTYTNNTHASLTAPRQLTVRTFAAVKPKRQYKKKDEKKVKEEKKEKKVIDNTGRHKPFGLTAWAPVDDVYLSRYYPRPAHGAAEAVDLLKSFQHLDLTPPHQAVYIELKLDMKLEKKKKVDTFVSTVHLPHPFKTEVNKVGVFTEDPDQASLALENGAAFAGGADLVQKILDDEVDADFYVAVPDMLPKLVLLKNKLRKKFPKSRRGSVGINIPKMLELFKTGHEYLVEKECYVSTQVGLLDMPKEHVLANIQTVLVDVCTHRPASYGPFIERAIISSQTSEALHFSSEELLPKELQKE